jgi:hypothetical protein
VRSCRDCLACNSTTGRFERFSLARVPHTQATEVPHQVGNCAASAVGNQSARTIPRALDDELSKLVAAKNGLFWPFMGRLIQRPRASRFSGRRYCIYLLETTGQTRILALGTAAAKIRG